jgi:hypothetical protein
MRMLRLPRGLLYQFSQSERRESRHGVTEVTGTSGKQGENECSAEGLYMPVLIIALVALAVFGGIGVLLLTAMVLEHRMLRRPGVHGMEVAAKH